MFAKLLNVTPEAPERKPEESTAFSQTSLNAFCVCIAAFQILTAGSAYVVSVLVHELSGIMCPSNLTAS